MYSAGASYSSPSSSADVKVSPLLTTVPSAFVTVPNVGSPVTVIVRLSPSSSVGAASPKDVSVLSSSTVMLLLSTTGGSLTGLILISVLPSTVTVPSLTE